MNYNAALLEESQHVRCWKGRSLSHKCQPHVYFSNGNSSIIKTCMFSVVPESRNQTQQDIGHTAWKGRGWGSTANITPSCVGCTEVNPIEGRLLKISAEVAIPWHLTTSRQKKVWYNSCYGWVFFFSFPRPSEGGELESLLVEASAGGQLMG